MKQPALVLDAYGLIYRSYFAFISKPLTNREGNNVSAVFGFFRTLHTLFERYDPKVFIAAFDSRSPTFRHEMYAEYKATRQKTPEDLHAQVPIIEEILTALGIAVVRQDGFEADDIIASVASRCASEGRECRIISGDKDLMQLVGGGTTILKAGKTGGWDEVDAEGVRLEWGVGPKLMLDLLSLTGDASDNVPGIKGVGDKTALKLLEAWGSLDGIFEHAEEITGAIGTKIREGMEAAYFSKSLIALNAEVPLERELDSYACLSLDRIAGARLLLREGLPSLAKLYAPEERDIKAAASSDGKDAQGQSRKPARAFSPPLSDAPPATSLTKNVGTYQAITDADELDRLIDKALSARLAAFDCETTSLDPREARLVGFSLSLKRGEAFYVPLIGPSPQLGEDAAILMDANRALAALTRLFSSKDMTVVLHNAKFDYSILKLAGVFDSLPRSRPACTLEDTMIAAWLLDPDWAGYSLESLATSQLGLDTVPYDEVVPKGATFADVPIEDATRYAAEDADLTLALREVLTPKLKEEGLTSLYESLELPLIPILADMELAGIRLVPEALSDFSKELALEIERTEAEIFRIAGKSFNIGSPKQLQEILFVERKLSPGKKTKTGYSTDNSVLESLASEDALPGMVLDWRGLAKLKSTYVDALPALADGEGRVHTSFMQTGTATGRLSSRDPNLQNIPIREETGRRIRSAFRAREGYRLVSADYAQIELVILAHLSGDDNLVDAFVSGVDVHKRTASLIFGVAEAEVTPEMRRTAKTINFGVMYGMSSFRLANELRIPRGEAASFINAYFQTYAGVSRFIADTKESAEKNGYVETIMGRRRYIRAITSANKLEKAGAERVAVNTPIQGSAADIVKTAMIRLDAALSREGISARLLLQVHDELILECPDSEVDAVEKLVQREMESVIALKVPLRVSVESGQSWGEFH